MRFSVAILLSCLLAACARADLSSLESTAVLDQGRVKPLDTLARETVRMVTGKERFGVVEEDAGEQQVAARRDAIEMLLGWTADPQAWANRPIIYVPHLEVRKRIGLGEKQQWISPEALIHAGDFSEWTDGIQQRQSRAEQTGEQARLTPVEQAAIEVRHRLMYFRAASAGRLINIVPSSDPNRWLDLETLRGSDDPKYAKFNEAWNALARTIAARPAAETGKVEGIGYLAQGVESQLTTIVPASAVNRSILAREVFYHHLHPFRIVWIGYLLAVVTLIASLVVRRREIYLLGMAILLACVLGHVAAFAMRCSITGWAPVTNMYETVVWVALVAAVIAVALEMIHRSRVVAIGGAVTALLAAIVADVMPADLGGQIRNLAPVLRSNYWLTIHVLTIVSSYAAFALACVLGNIVLGQFLLARRPVESIGRNLKMTYRSIQVGVLLIAAGTILGGLWADVSWGRFWGWDPKEVWALIVLLTYLALLHGRFAGWIGTFGLAAGAVICFSTVLMSWYGVNFVLGVGLHSYGFGTGGQGWVAVFVLSQIGFVIVARVISNRNFATSARRETGTDSGGMALPISSGGS